jgi:hypothetical protein
MPLHIPLHKSCSCFGECFRVVRGEHGLSLLRLTEKMASRSNERALERSSASVKSTPPAALLAAIVAQR